MIKKSPTPISTDFNDSVEQLSFAAEIASTGSSESHISQFYSQLPTRILRAPKDGKSIVTRNFVTANGQTIRMDISPAIIQDEKTLETSLIYPKTLEDRVVDALAYIAAHDSTQRMPKKHDIGVRFSIRQLQTTIKHLFGKTYRRDNIKNSLLVLAGTSIDLSVDGFMYLDAAWSIQQKHIHRITGLTLATKDDSEQTKCFCWLNALFVSEIIDGSYTVHDLRWQAELNNDLAEELFKKLSLNYKNASTEQTYNFDARLFLENTCYGFTKTSWTDLDQALRALIEHDVIVEYQEKKVFQHSSGRPKLINKTITVRASKKFINATREKVPKNPV